MSIGPERARLRQYLQGARHEATGGAGDNWAMSADVLGITADAMKEGMTKVRDGNGTEEGLGGVTAGAILEAFQASAESMKDKSVKIVAAGEALRDTSEIMRKAEEAEAKMAVLEQPAAYTPPNYSPGYEPTADEIKAEGDKRSAANARMNTYNSQMAEQESASSDWSQKMDAAFLAAIPPMKAIHGEKDPTEPPPSVPSNPSTPTTPTTPGTPGTPSDPPRDYGIPVPDDDDGGGKDKDKDKDKDPTITPPPPPPPEEWPPPPPPPTWPPVVEPTPVPNPHPTPGPTTTVIGTSQSGIDYNPSSGSVSAPTSSGSAPSAGASAAALGAAGGAGGMAAGAMRPGAVPTSATRGAAPVRAIGSTGRAGSAGALSRSAGSAGSAGRAGSAGSPTSRGAGSAGGRGAGSASGRGAGSAGGRGGAGGRGAGSGSGSRSGARGAAGGASGRGGRKGEDEKSNERDSLVYDQDWLGDDDVAPGVLD